MGKKTEKWRQHAINKPLTWNPYLLYSFTLEFEPLDQSSIIVSYQSKTCSLVTIKFGQVSA